MRGLNITAIDTKFNICPNDSHACPKSTRRHMIFYDVRMVQNPIPLLFFDFFIYLFSIEYYTRSEAEVHIIFWGWQIGP